MSDCNLIKQWIVPFTSYCYITQGISKKRFSLSQVIRCPKDIEVDVTNSTLLSCIIEFCRETIQKITIIINMNYKSVILRRSGIKSYFSADAGTRKVKKYK